MILKCKYTREIDLATMAARRSWDEGHLTEMGQCGLRRR
jgi:hypothetical protein